MVNDAMLAGLAGAGLVLSAVAHKQA